MNKSIYLRMSIVNQDKVLRGHQKDLCDEDSVPILESILLPFEEDNDT